MITYLHNLQNFQDSDIFPPGEWQRQLTLVTWWAIFTSDSKIYCGSRIFRKRSWEDTGGMNVKNLEEKIHFHSRHKCDSTPPQPSPYDFLPLIKKDVCVLQYRQIIHDGKKYLRYRKTKKCTTCSFYFYFILLFYLMLHYFFS